MSESRYEKLYYRAMDELSRRDLTISESRDRAILFNSIPILAMVLAFCKFIIPSGQIIHIWLVGAVAFSFFMAIISVMVSYLTSIWAKRDMEKKIKNYLENKGKGEKPASGYNRATEILNFISAGFYLIGILLIALFFYFNFPK